MDIHSKIGSKERLLEMFQNVNKLKINEDSYDQVVTNDAGEPMGTENTYSVDQEYPNDPDDGRNDYDVPKPKDFMGFNGVDWRLVHEILKNNSTAHPRDITFLRDMVTNDMDTRQSIGVDDLGLLSHANLDRDWGVQQEIYSEYKRNIEQRSHTRNPNEYLGYTYYYFDTASNTPIPQYDVFVNAVKNAYDNPPQPDKPDPEERYRGMF
jgi:hypothetical protein